MSPPTHPKTPPYPPVHPPFTAPSTSPPSAHSAPTSTDPSQPLAHPEVHHLSISRPSLILHRGGDRFRPPLSPGPRSPCWGRPITVGLGSWEASDAGTVLELQDVSSWVGGSGVPVRVAREGGVICGGGRRRQRFVPGGAVCGGCSGSTRFGVEEEEGTGGGAGDGDGSVGVDGECESEEAVEVVWVGGGGTSGGGTSGAGC